MDTVLGNLVQGHSASMGRKANDYLNWIRQFCEVGVALIGIINENILISKRTFKIMVKSVKSSYLNQLYLKEHSHGPNYTS